MTKLQIIDELENQARIRHQAKCDDWTLDYDPGEWQPWPESFKAALAEESLSTLQRDLELSKKATAKETSNA